MSDQPASAESARTHFEVPPIVEVSLGVQFRPLFGLRPIELAPLRERWRGDYPIVQEQPPLAPVIEEEALGAQSVQFVVGPALQTRLWFLSSDQSELVQVQHDRLSVNWRRTSPEAAYPHYDNVRDVFERRFRELDSYVHERDFGALSVTQAEVDYINAVEVGGDELGEVDRFLELWRPVGGHHLGAPEQGRAAATFRVPDVGAGPVRLHVAVDPAQRPDGQPLLLLNLTLRGAPSDATIEAAMAFVDQGHEHVVQSFLELTPERMHHEWGKRQ